MTSFHKLQQALWRLIYPIFPYIQRGLVFLHQNKRQRYHLGWLAEGRTLEELKHHLSAQGFGNHFIAWTDPGQVLSWRHLESFRYQYHIRVFADGEIRGHYEFTPEAHPIRHFCEVGEEARTEQFQKFLGAFLTDTKTAMRLDIDETMARCDRQFTWQDACAARNKSAV